LYWFDDSDQNSTTRTDRQCRVPESWRLLYKSGDNWKPIQGAGEYSVKKNAWIQLRFPTVTTTGLRIEVQLRSGYSAGILEWRVVEE